METGNAEIVGATMEKALLCLRVMRKLTVHGFKTPHQTNSVMEFVQSLYERIKNLLQYRKCWNLNQLIVWSNLFIYRSSGSVKRQSVGVVRKIFGCSLQSSERSTGLPSFFLCPLYPHDCRVRPSLFVPTREPSSTLRFLCSTVFKPREGHCTLCRI